MQRVKRLAPTFQRVKTSPDINVLLELGGNDTYQFHCNSLPLEVVEDYKYLGLWISKRNFKKAIHHVSYQSKKIIFVLKQCLIKLLQTPPVSVALHLFNSII